MEHWRASQEPRAVSGAAQPHWVLGGCWGLNVSTDKRLQSSPAPHYPGQSLYFLLPSLMDALGPFASSDLLLVSQPSTRST